MVRAGDPEQLVALILAESPDDSGESTCHTAAMVAAPTTRVFTDDEVASIRSTTPGCRDDLIHLNHAGSSLPDERVIAVQIEHLRREAEIGGYEASDEAAEREDAAYDSFAALVGGRREEIARFEHATAAWNAAFWSIPMRPGQRIITHDHDYGANVVAFLHAAEVHGVEIVRIASDRQGQIDLGALEDALSEPSQIAVVSLTWVPTSGGLVNPAAAVGSLTQAAGVPFLLDACQAAGQLVIDVDALGCDFLSVTGRKYLRGPRGSGFLWVRDAMLDRVRVSQPDHHGADWVAIDRYEPLPDARRFEYWEYSHASWLGLGRAVDLALELGIDRIQATVARRAAELRRALTDIGMTVHDQGVATCGIVTATHPSVESADLQARLRARGVNASTTFAGSARADMEARALPPMLRLSVHCTTTADEIERAAAAITELV